MNVEKGDTVTNREHNKSVLADCNALANYDTCWLPVRVEGDSHFSPSGLQVIAAKEWKPASLDEILDHMDADNSVAMVGFGAP